MSGFVEYPEYRDSGVEWLGDVPTDWNLNRLKHLCRVRTGSKDTVDAVEFGKYPFFVRSQTIERINTVGAECEAVLTAGDGVGVGKVYHYVNGKFDFHQRVYMLNYFREVVGRYFYYYLSSNFHKVALDGNAKSTVDSLRLPQFLNFEITFPTKLHQQKIVEFLNHETAKIDTLIEKQQQLIKLLKEKRQAVISHAVTKGLNPDAPMKDSGVEWLGEVPVGWESTEIRFITTQLGGGTPSKDNSSFWNGDIPWVSPKDMKVDYIEDSQDKITANAISGSSTKMVPVGSVLLVVRGMILAHSVPVALTMKQVTINQDMKALVPNRGVCGEYLLLLLKGFRDCVLDFVENSAHGTKCIRTDDFDRMKIAIPNRAEQAKICEEIKQRVDLLDKLVFKVNSARELLAERRTALISAAVTGKIDVRNWQPPKSTATPSTDA